MWYPAAIDRFIGILKSDPEYHAGATPSTTIWRRRCVQVGQPAEALPYLDKLVKEFEAERISRTGAEADRRAEGGARYAGQESGVDDTSGSSRPVARSTACGPIADALWLRVVGAAIAAQAQRPPTPAPCPHRPGLRSARATLDAAARRPSGSSVGRERVKTLFAAGRRRHPQRRHRPGGQRRPALLRPPRGDGPIRGAHRRRRRLVSIHTAGWLTIVEAQSRYVDCDDQRSLRRRSRGWRLSRAAEPAAGRSPRRRPGEPDFVEPGARDPRRRTPAARRRRRIVMVIDRGTDHGLRPGQRLTLFRQPTNGTGPIVTHGRSRSSRQASRRRR